MPVRSSQPRRAPFPACALRPRPTVLARPPCAGYLSSMRTPELVLVPALVGLPAAQAHEVAMAARVVAIDPDPDTPPTVEGTVTAQQPEAGTRVPAGEAVTIWVEPDSGGGGGGGNMPRVQPDKPLDGAGAN